MTKEEFITRYCGRSGISKEAFDTHFVAMPCTCDADNCRGWAAVNKDPLSITVHLDLYTPKETIS